MKHSLIALAFLAASTAGFATPGNNGNGNGGCGVGQTTNGCGGTAAPATSGTVNNGYGGAGGQGGAGGHGTGIGVGIGQGGSATATGGQGGSVLGSGNSSSSSGVIGSGNSSNTLGQHQGQGQSQSANNSQGQSQSATGGSASQSSVNDNRSQASNRNVNAAQGNTTNVNVAGDTVTYEAQKRAPVSTAYSGPLTASNGTCMGSSSAGAQGVGFGISLGSTWTDQDCNARYDATALTALGLQDVAVARLCQSEKVASAMQAAGKPCPGAKAAAQAEGGGYAAVASTKAAGKPEYTDPIIRARLGLPPLSK